VLTAVELNANSPDCVIALRQLAMALQTTREFIEQCFTNEETPPIVSDNALPNNRNTKFRQAGWAIAKIRTVMRIES
jgi:hypothetical protein